MNTTQTQQLAVSLMSKHGLEGWEFRYSRARRALGTCDYRTKTISLSRSFVEKNTDEQVLDTILHEIAHALTPGAGHGWQWRVKCMELGCRPVPYATANEVVVDWKWETVCTTCGNVTGKSFGKRRSLSRRRSNCCRGILTQREVA